MPTRRVFLLALGTMLAPLLAIAPRTVGAGGPSAVRPRRVVIEPRSATGLVATVGKPLKLWARLELENGKSVPMDEQVTWTSANPSILRVAGAMSTEPPGSVTLLRAGIAGVTITYPRVSDPSVMGAMSRMLGDAITITVVNP